eukprot:1157143-Pelagomonas_calceolata.AAC.2
MSKLQPSLEALRSARTQSWMPVGLPEILKIALDYTGPLGAHCGHHLVSDAVMQSTVQSVRRSDAKHCGVSHTVMQSTAEVSCAVVQSTVQSITRSDATHCKGTLYGLKGVSKALGACAIRSNAPELLNSNRFGRA